jgi:hypothetical protein
MDKLKKTQIILDNLDEITAAVEQAILIEDRGQRRAYLKSVLFYWLGIIVDNTTASEANVEIALSAAQAMVTRLKEQNKILMKRISDNR